MSGDIDLYNINEVCRLCLKCDGTILPIFGLEHSSRDCIPLSYKIKACVSVEINKNDDFPKKICVGCVHQVDSWHKFKTLCDSSQNKLRSWFKSQSSGSRPSNQMQGEVKQELVDIEDNDVICCDEELDGDFNGSMPMPECDVILIEDDNEVVNDDDDDDDDDNTGMDNDNIDDEDDEGEENTNGNRSTNQNTNDDNMDVDGSNDNLNASKTTDDNCKDMEKSAESSLSAIVFSESPVSVFDKTKNILIRSISSQSGIRKISDKQSSSNSSKKCTENEQGNVNGMRENNGNDGLMSDERMLADFHDELAPDLELNAVDKNGDSQPSDGNKGENKRNDNESDLASVTKEGETCYKVLKDKSSNIIDRISSEINRRLSLDDNLNIDYSNVVANGRNNSESDKNDVDDSISNNDVDDSTSVLNEEEEEDDEEEEEEEVVIEKRELRPRNRKNTLQDSASNVSESGIVIVEGFSLSDYNSRVVTDVQKLHDINTGNQRSSSGPDLELLEHIDTANPNMEVVYNIKQEPASPTAVAVPPVEPLIQHIKRELDDWTSMPSEPIDIKPDIALLGGFDDLVAGSKGKKRKYPQFKNGIPCEPCKSSFPNYVKWIRHTKSHKHQRNVAFYDINRRSLVHGNQPIDPMNVLQSSVVQDIIPPKRQLTVEIRQNPCPIGDCQASFKHRRNLVTHVRTHHGYRLKDLEVKSPTPKANNAAPTTTSESINSSKNNGDNDDDCSDNAADDSRNGDENKSLFKCSHCPKEFDLRISLKTHLLMKHRIASVTAKLKCDRCFKSFHRKTGLLSHMRSCGKYVKSRRCPYCLMVFPTTKETAKHKVNCPKRYVNSGVSPSVANMNNVDVMANEDGSYSCQLCNITFEVQSVFYNHMEIYHSGSLNVTEQNQQPNTVAQEKSQSDEPDTSGNNVGEQICSVDQVSDDKLACRYCIKSFDSVEELQDHISYHDVNKIFQCKLCFATLNCKRYFQDHMRSHFIQHPGQYLCWTCFKPFNNRRDLTAHKNLHIKLKIFSCNICKHSFNSVLSLERHKNVHCDPSANISDKKVDEELSHKTDVKNPVNANENNLLNITTERLNLSNFNCHICKKNFSSEMALEKHSKLHNPVKMEVVKKFVHVCSNCRAVFKSSSALNGHLTHCKRRYESSTDDKRSVDMFKNSVPKVRCDKCHSVFATKISLHKHKKLNRCPLFRIEKYGKLYHCRYCKKSCQTIYSLYRHLKNCKIMQIKRRAAGVDSNHCIKCRKQFSSLNVLFTHEKFCNIQKADGNDQIVLDDDKLPSSSTPLLPGKLKCGNCNLDCHSEESLKRHMKFCKAFGGVATEESITGERFFSSCNNCGRKFTTSLSYKLHKKFCTGDNTARTGVPIRCRGCGRLFGTKDRLRVHEKVCKPFLHTPLVILSKPQDVHSCSCGRIFQSSSQLNSHKETCAHQNYEVSSATGSTSSVSSAKSVAKSSILTCEYCYKQFNKYQAKNSHMRVCQVKLRINPKNRKPYPSGPVSTASVTITHVPPPNSYNCVVCKGTFDTEEELIDHSCHEYSLANNMEINNITVEPDIPQEILDMQPRLPTQQQPQYIKSPKRVFKCYPCNKIFSGSSALNKHSQLFHGQSPATANVLVNADGSTRCPKCPRSFRDHKSLTHHMGWHTRQGGLETIETTSSSGSSFPPAELIISPVEEVQPPQQNQFSCSICFRKFLGKGPLQNHMRVHANILGNQGNQPNIGDQDLNSDLTPNVKRFRGNSYRCKICPKVFKDKLSLINHHNLHKTVSPANSLKAKILSRAGKTYVSCNICHKILSSNSIPKHNKLHRMRGDRPMFPQVSPFSLAQMTSKTKQPAAPSSSVFPCGFCFKLFRNQSSLNEHMVASHGYNERPTASDKRQQSPLQQQLQQPVQQYSQPAEIDEDDDVVLIEEDEQDNEVAPMTPVSGNEEEDAGDSGEHLYKCEICDKSWKHRSVYLRHVNAPSHKELTKRLSDILTRVNHDVNAS